MATADQVALYLSGCSDFIKSQERLMTPELAKDSMESMARSVTAQLNNCARISTAEATALNEAILASVFSGEVKSDLANVVLRRVTDVGKAAPAGRKQTMNWPFNYLTSSDWEYLKDQRKSNAQLAQRVRDRLVLVGLLKPTEPTLGKLASLIAAAREPDMEPSSLHALVLDLKHIKFGSSGQSAGLSEYPQSANDLPAHLFNAAYADEPPAPMVLEHFNALVERCPLRASHKTVRAPSLVQVTDNRAPQHGGIDMSMMQQMLTSFMQMHANQNSQRVVFTPLPVQDAPAIADVQAAPLERTASGTSSADAPTPTKRGSLSALPSPSKPPSESSVALCHPENDDLSIGKQTSEDIVADIEKAAGCGVILSDHVKPKSAVLKKPSGALKRPASVAAMHVKKPSSEIQVPRHANSPLAVPDAVAARPGVCRAAAQPSRASASSYN